MNFNVAERTIYLVKHGSHAYGLNTPTSDLDIKGICIEPKDFYFGYLHNFEQYEAMANKGHPEDKVIYSLKKFMKLAADCNPNIIEVLHVDESDIIHMDEFGEWLRDIRDAFLSKKARYTFSGYAHAQLKRIKTHRAWLLDPPKCPPTRKEFGLSETSKISRSELGAFDAAVEAGYDLTTMNAFVTDEDLFERLLTALKYVFGRTVRPKDAVTLFTREKQYAQAKTTWDQYQHWKKTRNPARAALEEKYGYDTKHGSHLIRLMRMCVEILQGKGVLVRRPDWEYLLGVKMGLVAYDPLIEEAEGLERLCEELYETSLLPHAPDHNYLHGQCVQMIEEYIKDYG